MSPVSPTPDVGLGRVFAMGDLAAVLVARRGHEGDALGQVEAPVALEGQVGLIGAIHLLLVLQQLDAEVRGVEAAHVADQDVLLAKEAWLFAVHLHLRWRCGAAQ